MQNKGKYGTRSEAHLGLFCRHMSPLTVYGDKEEERPAGPPPLGPCLQRGGSKAALGFAPPPLAARLRWPGTPAPGQHQPHLMFGGQVWPPLARQPRCLRGGGVAACSPLSIASGGTREKRQHCGQRQGVRPLCASDSPWARPGVRTGRAGNLRPASAPPVTVLGFSPPAPPLGG